jgi:AcrR family transcriptional regulator
MQTLTHVPANVPATQDAVLDTRQRLLEAAGEVFAAHGFHHATIREICKRAGANVAAVNYHFRDKETLYSEVLAWCAKVATERYPLGAGLREDATPRERLRAFIRNYMDRLLAEGRPAWHGRLISREMVDPSKALDQIAELFVKPQYNRLFEIVDAIIGPGAPEPVIRRCAASVVGQCLFYKNCRPLLERILPNQGYGPEDRAAIAEHVYQFALSALEAVKQKQGAGGEEDGGAA